MAQKYGPRVTTDGLVLCLDAADNNSAPNDDLPIKKGLVGWWDAADDTTITTSGSNVTQWRDKSGSGYHMSVPSSYSGPSRQYTLNGRKVLTFTSSNGLETSTFTLQNSNYTIIGVSRYTSTGQSSSGRVIQANSNNWLLGHHGGGVRKYYAVGWVTSTGPDDTNWRIYTGTGNISGDLYNFYVSGNDETAVGSGGSAGPNGLGVNTGYAEHSNCECSEIIAFNRVLSSDERTKVHNYLQNKWNIPVSDSKWTDRSSNSASGTFVNEPFYKKLNKGALEFDGTDQYINLGTISSGNSLYISQGSIDLWFKYSASQNGIILGWGAESTWGNLGVANNWTGSVSNESIIIGSYKSSTDYYAFYVTDGADYYGDGNWHHIVFTKGVNNSTNIACYIDGVQKTMLVAKAGTGEFFLDNVTSSQLNIGKRAYSADNAYYNGQVASLKIYNKILTQAEALQNYNATKGRFQGLGTYYRPAESAAQILEAYPNSPNGTYWIKPAGYSGDAQEIYCDMAAGGWMLVASNNASDTTIPGGNSRNSSSYFLNRNGTNGALGTPHPDSDYIIGNMIDSLSFSSVRIFGWGRNSTNGTYSWTGDDRISDTIVATWNLSSSGSSRRTEVVALANVTLTGTTTLHGSALYFVLDAVACDSGLNANANQTTVGGAGVASSSGDPSGGTYLGHGSTEGSYEGWYISGSGAANSQGYTTWVK